MDDLADCCAYDSEFQNSLSFTGYWRDPYALQRYRADCIYLPELDNEKAGGKANETYKQNILSLKNFVLGYSDVDTVLIPRQTGWFGVYTEEQQDLVTPLEDRRLWKEDLIGLRALNETGRLHKFTSPCAHNDYWTSCFDDTFKKYALPFLK